MSRVTAYRHRVPLRTDRPRRRGPLGPMADGALAAAIRAVLSGCPFHGEGHRQVWARLRMAGVRTSKRRVLRLMGEHGLLAPSRVGSPRGPRNHDGTIIPDRVDAMWGTDLTTTWTGEGQAAVFVAVDHHSVERFIRILKENLLWVQTFDAVEQLRQALIERHGFRPPDAIRAEQLPTVALAA